MLPLTSTNKEIFASDEFLSLIRRSKTNRVSLYGILRHVEKTEDFFAYKINKNPKVEASLLLKQEDHSKNNDLRHVKIFEDETFVSKVIDKHKYIDIDMVRDYKTVRNLFIAEDKIFNNIFKKVITARKKKNKDMR